MKIEKILGKLVKAENTLRETEEKHQKSETKLKSVEIRIMNYKKKIKSLREEISKNEEKITAMKELNRIIIEIFEKLNSKVEILIKKVRYLEKEINDEKLQNKALRKENENLKSKLDDKDSHIKLVTMQKEELQQQLSLALDKLKNRNQLTGETQVENNENQLIESLEKEKEKNKESEKNLQLATEEIRRLKHQMLTEQELKIDINDIPGCSTSIKTEFELKSNKNVGK